MGKDTKYKKSELYNKIKEDLLIQLNQKENNNHYVNLIDDYMSFWVAKCMLIADINKRGASVSYNNGGGQSGFK